LVPSSTCSGVSVRTTVSPVEDGVSWTVIALRSLPAGLKAAAVVAVLLNQPALDQSLGLMAISRSCWAAGVLALGMVAWGAARGLRAVAWLQVPPPAPSGPAEGGHRTRVEPTEDGLGGLPGTPGLSPA